MIDGITLQKINNLNLPEIKNADINELNAIYDSLIKNLTSNPYCEIKELYEAVKDRIDYLVSTLKKQNKKEVKNKEEILFYMDDKNDPTTMKNIPVVIVDWIVFLSYVRKNID